MLPRSSFPCSCPTEHSLTGEGTRPTLWYAGLWHVWGTLFSAHSQHVELAVCTYIHCVHPCITTTSCLKTDRQNLCQQAIVLTKHQNSLPCSFHFLDDENAHSTGAVVPVAWMTNIHILPQAQLPYAMHHHHRRMLPHAMHHQHCMRASISNHTCLTDMTILAT